MNLVCVSGMADASASGGAGQVPTQRGERERSPTRTPTTQEQQQPTQGPQRFRMNSPEGGQGLPGGATAPYASIYHPHRRKLPVVVEVCQEVQLDSKKFSPLRR